MIYCAPMLRLFKTWLILLLIAAVPLHAATAGMGLACASAAVQASPGASPAAALPTASCHRHAAIGMDADAAAAQAGDSGAQNEHPSCSACSAACMGACMPPPVPGALPILAGAESVSIAAMPLLAGIIPDGLRRPPRRLHA